MIPTNLPATKIPVTLDGWYEHVDGTFGHYVNAAKATGPSCTGYAATAAEAVHRDEHGNVWAIGWPARAAGVAEVA